MISIAIWIFAFSPFQELTECDYEVLGKGKNCREMFYLLRGVNHQHGMDKKSYTLK